MLRQRLTFAEVIEQFDLMPRTRIKPILDEQRLLAGCRSARGCARSCRSGAAAALLCSAPFALERLELLEDERVVYRLPKPQRDGTTALTLTPLKLIDHLAALIPPPRLHRHRYHGVLAPNSPLRAAAIAYGRAAADDPSARDEVAKPSAVRLTRRAPAPNARSPGRYLWAMLLARLFESLPLTCPNCGAETCA